MEQQDKILFMARESPLTPTQVAKAIGKDSWIASAMLSALVEKGLLKISNVKIGSTPLYYDPNHSDQLQRFSSYLNEKDRRVYDLLKEKKILRENALDPLSRVCVKNIKDFARPLEVSFNNVKEIFWKWYLLPDTEAEPIIRGILTGQQPESQTVPKAETVPKPEPQPASIPELQPELEPAPKPALAPETETKKVKPEKQKIKPEKHKASPERPKTKKPPKKETQKRIVDKIKEIIKKPKTIKGSDAFLKQLVKYFENNNIKIIEQLEQKRKSEFEFIVEIESSIGALTYFCHAKDKKKIGEADMSNAFVQGQLTKLPVLFLVTGTLTKQAEKMMPKFKGVAYRKI